MHHQRDTHEALGQKVWKDRPQVDLAKTGFFSVASCVQLKEFLLNYKHFCNGTNVEYM